jgi:outer membrane protein FlgP
MNVKSALTLSTALALVGCVPLMPMSERAVQYPAEVSNTIKISAVGYGAASSVDGHTLGQRRLLAMRASRLDAYRALAEQVNGVRLTGNTTVSSLMSQNDSFRAYIDAYLRGARVVSVTPMADGNYETTIEIEFDERVTRPYLTPAPVQPGNQPAVRTYVAQPVMVPSYVVRPVAALNYAAQPVLGRPLAEGSTGAAGPGKAYSSSFYYAE